MVFVDLFFWISGGFLLLTMAYLWFLAIVSLLPEKKSPNVQTRQTRFAILIPAHNEAKIIKRTLKSVGSSNYPNGLYDVFVIADNCTDETVQLALESRVRVLERKKREQKGKGFALQWAFDSLKKTEEFGGYDAFVIIDADTVVDPGFLEAMDERIARGEMAIQGYYDVINPRGSPMASLSYLGFALSRNLKYKGRTRLGWSSNLLGNGMCFSRKLMDRFGWDATSIVEDMEYAVMLRLHGIRVFFAPEALVFAEIPGTFKGSRVQRSRWDIGRFQVRNKYVAKLVGKALSDKDIGCLDMVMELLIPPFALFVLLCLSVFILFLGCSFRGFEFLSGIWFVTMIALFAYILTGLSKAKADWKIYVNLIYAPFFLIWRVKTVIWGYLHKVRERWIKTARNDVL